MNKVYAVTSGSYSDYRVIAIFSTRDKAKEYIDAVESTGGWNPYYEYEIEDFDFNPPTVELLANGYKVFAVHMRINGDTDEVLEEPFRGRNMPDFSLFKPREVDYKKPTETVLRAKVLAKDEKHAIKIANEKRLQMIASGEWK